MAIFSKRSHDQSAQSPCLCYGGYGLCMPNRQLSLVISTFMVSVLFVFLAGYFWGQKKALEQMSDSMEQETLSDKIYSSLCMLYDSHDEAEKSEGDSGAESDESADLVSDVPAMSLVTTTSHAQLPLSVAQEAGKSTQSLQRYKAQLAGFGSESAAQSFTQRLLKKNINAEVLKRVSSTAKKQKSRTWYQVVTSEFQSKEELEKLVAVLRKEEHLKDVRIITC